MPKSNVGYWQPKIGENVARDADTTAALTAAAWQVLRFWEHEGPSAVADTIEHAVASWSVPEPRDGAAPTDVGGLR